MRRWLDRLHRYLQGPPGSQGETGAQGEPGAQGPPGPGFDPLVLPIKLRVPLVVAYSGEPTISWVQLGLDAAKEATDFYRRTCGIELLVSVSAINHYPPYNPTDYANQAMLAYWFQLHGQPFTCIVLGQETRFGDNYLGQAFRPPGGFCLVAGNQGQPGGGSLVDETLIHEWGHELGLHHEDGTFMRAVLETENRIVTPAQRAKVRETARQFGGL